MLICWIVFKYSISFFRNWLSLSAPLLKAETCELRSSLEAPSPDDLGLKLDSTATEDLAGLTPDFKAGSSCQA